MRNWTKVLGAGVLAGLGAACGAGEGEGSGADGLLAEGRYAYVSSHPNPVTGEPMRHAGALVVTHATGDSIGGRWDAEGLKPEVARGEWENGAFVAYAYPIYGGIAVHRITPAGAGGAVRCEGHYSWMQAGGIEREVPLLCELRPDPDAGVGEVPSPGPIVRPLDADTVADLRRLP